MKVLCAEYNGNNELAVVPVGDDVLLRNNQDFYIPEFTCALSCVPQLVIRMDKLGKGIGERFANRYYEEVGVGVRFYADTLEDELTGKGLPAIMASSFDSSAAISVLKRKEDCREFVYSMRINGDVVFTGKGSGLPVSVDQLVAFSSDYHTIKIGDFIFCGNPFRFRGLKMNDRIQMELEGEAMLDFSII